jgi:hypothetical protein
VNTRHGHDAAPGAASSPSARSRGSTPARSSDDLPAPDTPDTTSSPAPSRRRDIRSSTWAVAASRPKKNAASCSSNAASPPVGGIGHRPQQPRQRALAASAATITRQAQRRPVGEHPPRRGQHLRGRRLPPGDGDEQLPRRPGQAQRTGQQHRGVLAGGAADPPLQVTDRPRAHARRLRQLLLRQQRPSPQLPQQHSETQPRLLRHGPNAPPKLRAHRQNHPLRCADDAAPRVRRPTPPRYRPPPSRPEPPLPLTPPPGISSPRQPSPARNRPSSQPANRRPCPPPPSVPEPCRSAGMPPAGPSPRGHASPATPAFLAAQARSGKRPPQSAAGTAGALSLAARPATCAAGAVSSGLLPQVAGLGPVPVGVLWVSCRPLRVVGPPAARDGGTSRDGGHRRISDS